MTNDLEKRPTSDVTERVNDVMDRLAEKHGLFTASNRGELYAFALDVFDELTEVVERKLAAALIADTWLRDPVRDKPVQPGLDYVQVLCAPAEETVTPAGLIAPESRFQRMVRCLVMRVGSGRVGPNNEPILMQAEDREGWECMALVGSETDLEHFDYRHRSILDGMIKFWIGPPLESVYDQRIDLLRQAQMAQAASAVREWKGA